MAERKKNREKRARTGRGGRRLAFPGGTAGIYSVLAVLFLVVLFLGGAAGLIRRDRDYSDAEGREMAQAPAFAAGELADGRFAEQYETYRADQIPGRSYWVKIRTWVDSLCGKKEENGVFNGRDGYLLEDIVVPDEEKLAEKLDAMRLFRQTYGDVPMHMLLVPNAADVLENKLPFLAVTADQGKLIAQVKSGLGEGYQWIDAEKVMRKNREADIYYRTDPRWTTLGAYEVFRSAKEQLGIAGETDWPLKSCGVSNTFNGILSARSGYQSGYKEPMYVYLPKQEDTPESLVTYVEEGKKTLSLYDSEMLRKRDAYQVFMGGDHALVEIRTPLEQGESLLVVKDSYANCFIPFLAPYYREIVVVDPRYYTGKLGELMEEEQIDRVLFLYNANDFFRDDWMEADLLAACQEAQKSPAESSVVRTPQSGTAEPEGGGDSENGENGGDGENDDSGDSAEGEDTEGAE